MISNHATLNEEIDPHLMIARLKQEISRLKAELAIARGEGDSYPDGLPDYEKERINTAVDGYVNDSSADAELIFSDFKKIQYAFQIMKDWILSDKPKPTESSQSKGKLDTEFSEVNLGLNKIQAEQFEKLKRLAEHRDNEISSFA